MQYAFEAVQHPDKSTLTSSVCDSLSRLAAIYVALNPAHSPVPDTLQVSVSCSVSG